MNPKQQMLRSSVVVAFFNLLGGLSGILVETSIAANLGLSLRSDTFYVAYTIPYIITNLLTATGQFRWCLLLFAGIEQDERNCGTASVTSPTFLCWAGSNLRRGCAGIALDCSRIAPGFTHQQDVLATQLSRWLFLIIVPAGDRGVLRSFLLSRHYFALSTHQGYPQRHFHCGNSAGISSLRPAMHLYGYLAGYLVQLVRPEL